MDNVINIRKEKPKRGIRIATDEDTMTVQQYLNLLVARKNIDRCEAELIAKAIAEMGQIVETVSLGAIRMVEQDIKEVSQKEVEEREIERIDEETIKEHNINMNVKKTAPRELSNKAIIAKEEAGFWIGKEAGLKDEYNFTKAHQNFAVTLLNDPDRSVVPMTKDIQWFLENKPKPYVPAKLANAEVHFLLYLRICRYELGLKAKDQG